MTCIGARAGGKLSRMAHGPERSARHPNRPLRLAPGSRNPQPRESPGRTTERAFLRRCAGSGRERHEPVSIPKTGAVAKPALDMLCTGGRHGIPTRPPSPGKSAHLPGKPRYISVCLLTVLSCYSIIRPMRETKKPAFGPPPALPVLLRTEDRPARPRRLKRGNQEARIRCRFRNLVPVIHRLEEYS